MNKAAPTGAAKRKARAKPTRPAPPRGVQIVNDGMELVPFASKRVRPHPKNANEGDVGAIVESVRANGFYGAVIAQRGTGYILAGEHRYRGLEAEGATHVPVIWVKVSDRIARRILVADNRATRRGHDNPAELLELLMTAQHDGGLTGTLYDGDDLDELHRLLSEPVGGGSDGGASPVEEGFAIIVSCGSEDEQVELLDRFTAEGIACRALVR